MKILLVKPLETPRTVEINDTLEDMQRMVGGLIEEICPWDDDDPVAIVCNEEGKLLGLPANRILRNDEGYDVIAGTFFICGINDEEGDFTDIPEELVDKYYQMFRLPEIIF